MGVGALDALGLGQDARSCLGSRLEKFASAIKREPVDGLICIRAGKPSQLQNSDRKGVEMIPLRIGPS
jgi:hypothetical protein